MTMNTNTANIYITATDNTKQALSSISGKLRMLGGVIASVVAIASGLTLVNESLKKFADLSNFDKFDIGADKALQYVDSLKVVGLEAENINDILAELSIKITEALTDDDDLSNIFKEIGIDAKSLKNENIPEIFDKVLENIGKIDDKAKQVKIMDELFSDDGVKLLNASADERFKRIVERAKSFKEEIIASSFVSAELYKNIDEISTKATNKLGTAFTPVLVSFNALLEAFILGNDELGKTKEKFDIIKKSEPFKDIGLGVVKFANITYDQVTRMAKIFDTLWRGLRVGVIVIKALGDMMIDYIIAPFKGYSNLLSDMLDATEFTLRGQYDMAKYYFDKAMSFDMKKPVDRFNKEIEKALADSEKIQKNLADAYFGDPKKLISEEDYLKAFDRITNAVQKKINSKGGKENRKGITVPLDVVAITDGLLKDIQTQLSSGKDNIDFLMKYNDTMYNANLKTIEEFYQNKKELMVTDFEFEKSLIDQQINLLKASMSKEGKDEEKEKLQEKINDLLVKRNKLENDYLLQNIEVNSKSSKDIFDSKVKELNFITQVRDIEIEALREQGLEQGLILENNLKIKRIKEEQISLLEKENALILAQKNITPEDTIKLLENQKKIAVLKKNTDEIAKSLNDSINGAFETMFSNVLTGTKSLKEAFLDMANTINQEIMKILSQQLSQKLISNLMPTGSSGGGGLGGFFSNLLGGLGFRATGGGVNAGNAYVVGERGKELFIPQQSGYIVNNKDTMSALGGGSGNITVNIYTQNIESFRNSEARIASQIQKAIGRGNRVN